VQARHKPDFVPGSVLACVGLASQLGAAAGVSACLLQASSQSCQQVGGQLTCLPPTPPACRHTPRSADLQMPDRGHFGRTLSRGKVRRPVAEVRHSKALPCAIPVMPGISTHGGAEACTAPHCRNVVCCTTVGTKHIMVDQCWFLGFTKSFGMDA